MWKHLAEFGRKRTIAQAIVFYVVYLLIIIIIAILCSFAAAELFPSLFQNQNGLSVGLGIGSLVGGISCAVLAYLVLSQKGRLRYFSSFVYILFALALGFYGGGFFGLMLVAFLTTQENLIAHPETTPTTSSITEEK